MSVVGIFIIIGVILALFLIKTLVGLSDPKEK